MLLNFLHLCLYWALLCFPMVSANQHDQCYCKLNNVANKCLSAKACDIYRTSKQIFEDDPSKVNITLLYQSVCVAMSPDDHGRVWYVSGFGGNEFEQACFEAQTSGDCPEAEGGKIDSICR
ncbi:hypothetical protein LY78DRAFT_644974 [Colletotrichum sublineola]|nr:hypothetical protein LY78DRAFT_644974 [Colletotrichum sublineola]